MVSLQKNKGLTIGGLILLLLLTYFRENFLLEINAALANDVLNRAYSYWLADFFKTLSYSHLIKWKWGITILFSIIMSLITILSLYFWYKSKRLIKLVVYVYLASFLFVCVFGGLGFLFKRFDDVYFVLRKILGVIQSPIPFFVFL